MVRSILFACMLWLVASTAHAMTASQAAHELQSRGLVTETRQAPAAEVARISLVMKDDAGARPVLRLPLSQKGIDLLFTNLVERHSREMADGIRAVGLGNVRIYLYTRADGTVMARIRVADKDGAYFDLVNDYDSLLDRWLNPPTKAPVAG